jgi:hypothetical protein
LRYKPALNPPKEVFSIRIRPSALRDHILSQKLVVDVGVYTFPAKKQSTAA